jgi:hypothetical protein
MSKSIKQKKEIFRGGCPHCPGTEDLLDLKTRLYQGFGGYYVKKNGKLFFAGDPNGKWKDFPTLQKFENLARKSRAKWEVILSNPLRGATWRRKGKNEWALVETNLGFA